MEKRSLVLNAISLSSVIVSTNELGLLRSSLQFYSRLPTYTFAISRKCGVDGMLHKSVWEESTKKLNDEWQEFIFFVSSLEILD